MASSKLETLMTIKELAAIRQRAEWELRATRGSWPAKVVQLAKEIERLKAAVERRERISA